MTSYRDDKIRPTKSGQRKRAGGGGERFLLFAILMPYKVPHYIYIKLYPLAAEQLELQHRQVNLPYKCQRPQFRILTRKNHKY